jgi:transcription-repair coupling factor (superfamily II helicase)
MRIASVKQTGTALGIQKIDAAENGGYLVFGQQSHIDPVALVQLVQNDNRTYKLQGSHRLQFRQDLTDLENRFRTIEKLLAELAVKRSQAVAG